MTANAIIKATGVGSGLTLVIADDAVLACDLADGGKLQVHLPPAARNPSGRCGPRCDRADSVAAWWCRPSRRTGVCRTRIVS